MEVPSLVRVRLFLSGMGGPWSYYLAASQPAAVQELTIRRRAFGLQSPPAQVDLEVAPYSGASAPLARSPKWGSAALALHRRPHLSSRHWLFFEAVEQATVIPYLEVWADVLAEQSSWIVARINWRS